MSCDIKLRSGILPDSSYCPIYLKALRPMLPFSFYNNKIFKDSCHQAELGGSLGLKLLPLICKSSSADAATCLFVIIGFLKIKMRSRILPD